MLTFPNDGEVENVTYRPRGRIAVCLYASRHQNAGVTLKVCQQGVGQCQARDGAVEAGLAVGGVGVRLIDATAVRLFDTGTRAGLSEAETVPGGGSSQT